MYVEWDHKSRFPRKGVENTVATEAMTARVVGEAARRAAHKAAGNPEQIPEHGAGVCTRVPDAPIRCITAAFEPPACRLQGASLVCFAGRTYIKYSRARPARQKQKETVNL
jgi:hypothetical protein